MNVLRGIVASRVSLTLETVRDIPVEISVDLSIANWSYKPLYFVVDSLKVYGRDGKLTEEQAGFLRKKA